MWGCYISKTNIKKIKVCNNRAARLITGVPASAPAVPTCIEADLQPIRHVIEDEAALILDKYLHLQAEDHHLQILAESYTTPRLKAQGREGDMRPDWRRTARFMLDLRPVESDAREKIQQQKEEKSVDKNCMAIWSS